MIWADSSGPVDLHLPRRDQLSVTMSLSGGGGGVGVDWGWAGGWVEGGGG